MAMELRPIPTGAVNQDRAVRTHRPMSIHSLAGDIRSIQSPLDVHTERRRVLELIMDNIGIKLPLWLCYIFVVAAVLMLGRIGSELKTINEKIDAIYALQVAEGLNERISTTTP